MKRSDISELLMGKLSPEDFQLMYGAEVDEHLRLLKKGGASAPVQLAGDQYIFVNRANFRRLLQLFVVGAIKKEMLGYLLDALTLDLRSRFSDQATREMAMDLADENFDERYVEEVLTQGLSPEPRDRE